MTQVLLPLPTGNNFGRPGLRELSLLPSLPPQSSLAGNSISSASSSSTATPVTLHLAKSGKGRCGAGFQQAKKCLFVSAVAPGSICAEAGMQVGDTIVSIDGIPVEDFRHSKHKANGMLFDAKSTCTVVVIRNGADGLSAPTQVMATPDSKQMSAEAKVAADAKATAEAKAEAEAKVKAAMEKAKAEAKAKALVEAEAKAAVKAKAEAEAKAAVEAKAMAKAEAAAAAADNESSEIDEETEAAPDPAVAAKRSALSAKIAERYAQAKAAELALASKRAAQEAVQEAAWQKMQQMNAEAGDEGEEQVVANIAKPTLTASTAAATAVAVTAAAAAAASFSPGDAVIFDNPRNGVLELAHVLAVHVGSMPPAYTVKTANGQERHAEASQLTMSVASSAAPSKRAALPPPPPPPADPAAATEGNPHIYGFSKPGPRLGNGHHNCHEGKSNCHGPKAIHVPDLMLTSRGIGVPRNAKQGFKPGQRLGARRHPFGFAF